MKLKITTTILFTVFTLFAFTSIEAQIYQFDLNWHEGIVMGDLTQKEINAKGGGYVKGNTGGSVEFKGYEKNIGFGLKWSYSSYYRDTDAFETDLKTALGINDENYSITHPFSYRSYGLHFGVTYIINLTEIFHIEPYIWGGLMYFSSPLDNAVYFSNSSTMTYRKDPMLYQGFSYTPGVKFQWNLSKHGGINIFAEYEGMVLKDDVETSIVYSADSFEKTTIEQSYSPQSINFGLGFTWRFGKGLNDE